MAENEEKTATERFIEEVLRIDIGLTGTGVTLITIDRADAVAVARQLQEMQNARARGGRNSKGKAGPKVKKTTPEAKKHREYMREYRDRKP